MLLINQPSYVVVHAEHVVHAVVHAVVNRLCCGWSLIVVVVVVVVVVVMSLRMPRLSDRLRLARASQPRELM